MKFKLKSIDKIENLSLIIQKEFPQSKLEGKNLMIKGDKGNFKLNHIEKFEFQIEGMPPPFLIILAYVIGAIVGVTLHSLGLGLIIEFGGTVLTLLILISIIKTVYKVSNENKTKQVVQQIKKIEANQ